MFATNRGLMLLPIGLMAVLACNPQSKLRNQDPARAVETRADFYPGFVYMVDNAILHDMSLYDIHFVPHTAELSSTGLARLDRMSALLDVYGGVVRYDTRMTDEEMFDARLGHVAEYLASTGCNMDRVELARMQAGGGTMTAAEAVSALERGTAEQTGGSVRRGFGA